MRQKPYRNMTKSSTIQILLMKKQLKNIRILKSEWNISQRDEKKNSSQSLRSFYRILKKSNQGRNRTKEEIEPRNKGKYSMSKAIQYVLNNKEGLMEFTNDAIIPHDNTSCERSIRPFVVIRNRCKFSVSVHGAQASAMIYSLVISCIENKQNPYMYFTHLFENLPKLDLTNKEELRKYLPYNRELPSYIRTLSKSEIKAILNEAKSQV